MNFSASSWKLSKKGGKHVAVLLIVALNCCRPQHGLAQESSEDNLTSVGLSHRPQAGPSSLWLMGPDEDTKNEYSILKDITSRIGPDMRASADYHDFHDIQLNHSIAAWKILHKQAERFAQNQIQFYKGQLGRLLSDANVSLICQNSSKALLVALERLDSWAVQMWSATGNFPPVGLFDGVFTDIGSYRGCVDLNIPDYQADKEQLSLGARYASHCTIPFRPIVPSRRKFHMIFQQESGEILNMFDKRNIFNFIAHHSHFHHYVYAKTGVCVPAQCTASDIQRIAGIIGQRLAIMPGPVKCFSRATPPSEFVASEFKSADNTTRDSEIENWPVQVELDKPMNMKQLWAAGLVLTFFAFVGLATVWHCLELCHHRFSTGKHQEYLGIDNQPSDYKADQFDLHGGTGIKYFAFYYLSMITNGKEFLDSSIRPTEIKCLHGLRVLTMTWIICVHTLQYNDWSAFSRVFESVPTLQNLLLHPIYNANYVVDNFFFMSGLLAAYTTWHASKGAYFNFSLMVNFIGRYLRLTPQVLLVSLLYMLLPRAGDSPFWFDMSNEAAKTCEDNWWINLLHLQAFYKADKICNLVSWWISVDMFYYVLALALIHMILNNKHQRALVTTSLFVGISILISAYKHFNNHFPPNNLGTIPQIGEVWSDYVVHFFWTPYCHAFPFFLGLWNGYVLANNKWRRQIRNWSRLGWLVATISLLVVNMSSHIWMSGAMEIGDQYVSTGYNIICPIVWAIAYAWLVTACHYGCAPSLNGLLSIKLFVLLSKASFIIYLSHMLIVRMYFGLQNHMLEISVLQVSYIVIGNTIVSTIFGIFLCIAFEGPCMKFQKFVVRKLRPEKRSPLPTAGANFVLRTDNGSNNHKEQIDLGPTGRALLKN